MLGSSAAIAGRSMPGSVFSTKREMAISAPVLPALTQACAAPLFTRLMATRIEESFLKRSACTGGSSIATTWLAACTRTRAGAAARRELGLERLGHADQDQVDVGGAREQPERGGDRHAGTVVAPHAVDCDGDQRGYSSLARTTFLPR